VRPKKLSNGFKRFSLRIPDALYRKLRYAAIRDDATVNDLINRVTIEVPTKFPETGAGEGWTRYPARIDPKAHKEAKFAAEDAGVSLNRWIVAALTRAHGGREGRRP